MHNCPEAATRGHVVDARPTHTSINGGSRDSEHNAWTVNPTGTSSMAVTIATPVAKYPTTRLKSKSLGRTLGRTMQFLAERAELVHGPRWFQQIPRPRLGTLIAPPGA